MAIRYFPRCETPECMLSVQIEGSFCSKCIAEKSSRPSAKQGTFELDDTIADELAIKGDFDGDWLDVLRGIPDWPTKGQEVEESLFKWVRKRNLTNDELERAAIGLATAQRDTRQGYDSLARAFQQRLLKGFDIDEPKGNYKRSDRKKRGYY